MAKTYAAILFFIVDYRISYLAAGTVAPYQAVVLDWQRESILVVDMDTGGHTEILVEVPELSEFPGPIAIDSDGAVFVYYGSAPPGSLLARLDPTLSQWTAMGIENEIEFASDMDLKPDGNLILAAEFGIHEIDLATKTAQRLPETRTGNFDPDGGAIEVEIDSSGTITTGGLTLGQETPLFRLTPGAEVAERFDPGIRLTDFVLDSDGSVIGAQSETGTLYRLDFDTKDIDVLFESDVLAGTLQIELDPNGQIVALTRPDLSIPFHRLVRVDLGRGTADLITEFEGHELGDMDLLLPREGSLWAGDADQDLDFDQFDLIKVQQAGKYLTGQPATWGEGDWDGAPGGGAGNPPQGNGLFNNLDIIAALMGAAYLTGPYAVVQDGGQQNDAQTSIVYNATSGELSVDAPAGRDLTSINIDSASGIFTGTAATNLGGSFDNDADTNIFKATFGSSFGSLSFGGVAQAGLSRDFVLNDLTAVGSLAGGGDLGNVDLIYVPEPTAFTLAVALAASIVVAGRMRWARV